MALVSYANISAWLGYPSGSTEDQTLLEDLETRIVSWLESETRRTLVEASITDYFVGNDLNELWIRCPVKAGTTPTVSTRSGTTWTVLGSANWEINTTDAEVAPNRRRLIRTDGGVWPLPLYDGMASVRVVQTAGYTSSTVPNDLAQCIREVIAATYRARKTATSSTVATGGSEVLTIQGRRGAAIVVVPSSARRTIDLYTTPASEAYGISPSSGKAGSIAFARA